MNDRFTKFLFTATLICVAPFALIFLGVALSYLLSLLVTAGVAIIVIIVGFIPVLLIGALVGVPVWIIFKLFRF